MEWQKNGNKWKIGKAKGRMEKLSWAEDLNPNGYEHQ